MGVRGCQCVAFRSFFATGSADASDESPSEFSSAELASSICLQKTNETNDYTYSYRIHIIDKFAKQVCIKSIAGMFVGALVCNCVITACSACSVASYRLARGVLKAESELSEGEAGVAGVAGVAGDAAFASIESSVHDVVVSSFTESGNLPTAKTIMNYHLHFNYNNMIPVISVYYSK